MAFTRERLLLFCSSGEKVRLGIRMCGVCGGDDVCLGDVKRVAWGGAAE